LFRALVLITVIPVHSDMSRNVRFEMLRRPRLGLGAPLLAIRHRNGGQLGTSPRQHYALVAGF
jgi:hypothetical protein